MSPIPDPVDLSPYAPSLCRDEDGVWRAPEGAVDVSYPVCGHGNCLTVEDSSFWFRHRNSCICALVEKFRPSGPIFDVGGGNGVVASALAKAGHQVVLVEPGAVGVRNAKDRGLDNVVAASFEQAGFVVGSLPAIGLFDVIEHIQDDIGFLRSVRSTLAPGGLVYATVPAYSWLWSVDDTKAGHFRRYTREEITGVFRSAGLPVKLASYMFAPLPLPIFAMRTLPSRLGLLKDLSLERTVREHGVRGGLVERGFAGWFRTELRLVMHRMIPFGSSVLIAARREDANL